MPMPMRLMPPASGPFAITVPGGRSYSASAGGYADNVPDHDAEILKANGWIPCAEGCGTTAQRPANPRRGQDYFDSTLGKNIRFDGKAWRDPSSGSAV